MLNKRVCQECYARYRTHWNEAAVIAWEHGEVVCPFGAWDDIVARYHVGIDKPPPEWCKYACEHLVSQK